MRIVGVVGYYCCMQQTAGVPAEVSDRRCGW